MPLCCCSRGLSQQQGLSPAGAALFSITQPSAQINSGNCWIISSQKTARVKGSIVEKKKSTQPGRKKSETKSNCDKINNRLNRLLDESEPEENTAASEQKEAGGDDGSCVNRTPLVVYCKKCNAPAGFDIVHQTYRCKYCHEITGIQDAKQEIIKWKALNRSNRLKAANTGITQLVCPKCHARVLFGNNDASEVCAFCKSKLVRKELSDPSQLPDLIIPFFITKEEAKQRLKNWADDHKRTPEGKAVLSNMKNFRGYYLPYQIVKGPVQAKVCRDGTGRMYECGGYLEGTAVGTSRQLDNLVLNDMEPFDWSQARPFEYGYIAGQPVKLNDSTESEIISRVRSEVSEDFEPVVRKVMQTKNVDVAVQSETLDSISALLPVYFISSGKLTAVMNGQTGRIAVSTGRTRKSYPWVKEPLFYTTLITAIAGYFSGWSAEMMFYTVLVFGAIIFCAMGQDKTALIERISLKSETSKARRDGSALVIDEKNNILKNPYDNTPVFYEYNPEGKRVPVHIRFYTIGRVLYSLYNTFVMVFLPALLAAPLRLCAMEPGETYWENFHIEYGAAWYVLTGMIAVIYYIKGVRIDAYENPIIYEFLENGKKKLMEKPAALSIFYMLGLNRPDANGKVMTKKELLGLIRHSGQEGCIFIGGILFILLGSTLAMVC